MNILEQCRSLYKEAFCDGDINFENLLFENCFECCRFLEIDGEVVSMLFALPCKIVTGEKTLEAIYIYAAATKAEFKNKGYMSALIKSLTEAKKTLILRPASHSLIEFYEKLGFCTFSAQANVSQTPFLKPVDNFLRLTEKVGGEEENEFKAMCSGLDCNSLEGLYFPFSME